MLVEKLPMVSTDAGEDAVETRVLAKNTLRETAIHAVIGSRDSRKARRLGPQTLQPARGTVCVLCSSAVAFQGW